MAAIENRIVLESASDRTVTEEISASGNPVSIFNASPIPLTECKTSFSSTTSGTPWYACGVDSKIGIGKYTGSSWANGDGTYKRTVQQPTPPTESIRYVTTVFQSGSNAFETDGVIESGDFIYFNCKVEKAQEYGFVMVEVINAICTFEKDGNSVQGTFSRPTETNGYDLESFVGYKLTKLEVTLNIYNAGQSIIYLAPVISNGTYIPFTSACTITKPSSTISVNIAAGTSATGGTEYPYVIGTATDGDLDVLTGVSNITKRTVSIDSTYSATPEVTAGGTRWLIATGASSADGLISTYLKTVTSEYQSQHMGFYLSEDNGSIYASFGAINTLEGVQRFLTLHPLEVQYSVEDTEQFTPHEITPTTGANTFWSNGGDVSLTYTHAYTVKEYTPFMEFTNDRILSVNTDSSVSLVGEELYIDQFAVEVDYYVWIPYVFKPTDFYGFMSAGSKILCSKMNYDIRTLPYGTRVTHYMNGNISGVFYVQKVERTGREFYKISAFSAMGLMDKQPHKGGIYAGDYLQDVIEDIVGGDYVYIIDGSVATQRVYGWLPYATKRENLYQILLAYGAEIIVGDNGALFFTFPDKEQVYTIPPDRVYSGGKVIYDEPASRIEVNEHSYHYDSSVDEIQLFDNSADETVTDALVVFDQPIYPDSIYCSSGSLTISDAYTNYAVVSGSGILSGKPYIHNVRMISKDNSSAPVEKVVSVKDATLVTFVTSDSVLNRLAEFYFNAQRVEQAILVETEKPGHKYATQNAFGELMTGYISKMQKSITSVAKANCRFIQNYEPTNSGMSYTNRLCIPLGSGQSATWVIPEEVFQKDTPSVRVTLIGKGQTGQNGEDGATGTSSGGNTGLGKGGAGGLGGKGGLGGNILTVTLIATGLSQLILYNSGDNSVLSSAYYEYTSADGAPNNFGYFDILTGEVFAMPGTDGTNGGNGGDGDYFTHTTGDPSTAQPGEDVTYNSVTYVGGVAGERAIINGNTVGISGNLKIYVSACGGGGSAVGNNGGNAVGYTSPREWGDAGIGADAIDPPTVPASKYGQGGNGGHGGGGGGAGGMAEYWNYVYTSVIGTQTRTDSVGKGGKGSAGSEGNYGCAIIYW